MSLLHRYVATGNVNGIFYLGSTGVHRYGSNLDEQIKQGRNFLRHTLTASSQRLGGFEVVLGAMYGLQRFNERVLAVKAFEISSQWPVVEGEKFFDYREGEGLRECNKLSLDLIEVLGYEVPLLGRSESLRSFFGLGIPSELGTIGSEDIRI